MLNYAEEFQVVFEHSLNGAMLLYNNLPPENEWPKTLTAALLQANQFLKKLSTVAKTFQNPNLLLKPLIPNEIISKRTQTDTHSKFLITARSNLTDINNMTDYNLAIDQSLELLDHFSLSIDYLKNIHDKILCHDSKHVRCNPGALRTARVVLRNSHSGKIAYTPPSAEHLPELLQRFEVCLNDRSLHPLIHAAICHADFMNIHPFKDGNGRVGYLMTMVLLVEKQVLPANMLNLFVIYSYTYFHATQKSYAKLVRNDSRKKQIKWLIYFLDIMSLISNELIIRMESINHIIKGYHTKLLAISSKSKIAIGVVNSLTNTPLFTIHQMAEYLDVSLSGLRSAISLLELHHIISPIKTLGKTKIYASIEIMNILQHDISISGI
ncbi:MAG: Fic family protein [Legionellaceae bacterium]|nr:Fic family protein [Legionellaceae bacterium]